MYKDFSDDFMVKAEHAEEMETFLHDELKLLIENSQVIHHLESNGKDILLFIDNLRIAHIHDYSKIVDFAHKLKNLIR